MKKVRTVCARDCYDTCSLVFHVDEYQKITSVHGDTHHPLTRGMVCPRSARDRDRLLSNRIDSPIIKEAGSFKKVSWNQSLDLISGKLAHTIAKQGPHGILFLNYAGNTGLLANAFPARLWNALGAAQTDGALCSQSGHAGISMHYGDSYGANPLEIPSMKLLVFWGFILLLFVTFFAILSTIFFEYPLGILNPIKIAGNLGALLLIAGSSLMEPSAGQLHLVRFADWPGAAVQRLSPTFGRN